MHSNQKLNISTSSISLSVSFFLSLPPCLSLSLSLSPSIFCLLPSPFYHTKNYRSPYWSPTLPASRSFSHFLTFSFPILILALSQATILPTYALIHYSLPLLSSSHALSILIYENYNSREYKPDSLSSPPGARLISCISSSLVSSWWHITIRCISISIRVWMFLCSTEWVKKRLNV